MPVYHKAYRKTFYNAFYKTFYETFYNSIHKILMRMSNEYPTLPVRYSLRKKEGDYSPVESIPLSTASSYWKTA